MTWRKRQVLKMAEQASLSRQDWWKDDEALERFAEQVREEATAEANAKANASWTLMCEKMVAIERESIDQLVNDDKELSDNDAIRLSKAIRARGQA